ncbi:MAG: SRPBCC domain-containing protein [Planctomycetota bacterium]
MPRFLALGLLSLSIASCVFSLTHRFADGEEPAIRSDITKETNGDVFLTQTVRTKASLDKVWAAYTTSDGWKSWVAPVAEVDFKIGGEIRSNYRADGKITDGDTVKLRIVNYVPKQVLTLQAEVNKNWPEVLKAQEKRLYNVITFHELPNGGTKVVSHGIGYTNDPKLQQLLRFFVSANEQSFRKLISAVETSPQR